MGSITSRPKIPNVTYSTAATAQPISNTSAPDTPTTEANPEEIAKTRVENILRRSRSALGNVYTSFRGVLQTSAATPQRKSLLGE